MLREPVERQSGIGSSVEAELPISQARKQVAKRARKQHYPAPYAVLELWRKYDGNPFAASNDPSASIDSVYTRSRLDGTGAKSKENHPGPASVTGTRPEARRGAGRSPAAGHSPSQI